MKLDWVSYIPEAAVAAFGGLLAWFLRREVKDFDSHKKKVWEKVEGQEERVRTLEIEAIKKPDFDQFRKEVREDIGELRESLTVTVVNSHNMMRDDLKELRQAILKVKS